TTQRGSSNRRRVLMPEKPDKGPPKGAVGYGRPPKQHQFKPGQSGNPKGRPKGAPTLQEIMAKEATKHIKIKQGENIVTVLSWRPSRDASSARRWRAILQ